MPATLNILPWQRRVPATLMLTCPEDCSVLLAPDALGFTSTWFEFAQIKYAELFASVWLMLIFIFVM